MIIKNYLIFFTCVLCFVSHAQTVGPSIYPILQLSPSARVAALSGHLVSIQDSDDVVLAQMNPAIPYSSDHHQVAFNHSFYYAGSSYSNISTGYYLAKENVFIHHSLGYLDHGELQGADEFGNKTTTFKSSELVFTTGATKKLFDRLNIGVSLKYIFSQIETYNSSGLGIDLGTLYTFKSERQSLGFAIRNLGTQIKTYNETRETFPLDVQLGLTHRLEHVPFIFTFTAHHLQIWNIRTDGETTISILGLELKKSLPDSFTVSHIPNAVKMIARNPI